MIKKPDNYNNLNGGWESITPGGHRCVVKEVKETVSEWDPSVKVVLISFDTANDDSQPQYFTNQYMNDSRDGKKWRGTKSYRIDSEYFDGQISKFVGALEASNDGVEFWKDGALDVAACKNKLIGVVFRGEDYNKSDGTVGYAVKPFYFCNFYKAQDEAVPEPKRQESSGADPTRFTPAWEAGFVNVPADGLKDEGLPFA